MTKLNLTNMKIGRLTALYPLSERRNGRIVWHCRCDCGNEIDIISSSISPNSKHPTLSCGCLQKENTSKANRQGDEMIGQKFDKLTVMRWEEGKWLCQCDCGNITKVSTHKLKSGHTRSCGCLQKDTTANLFFKDLSGNRYGMLTVIKRRKDKENGKYTIYECQCDCGNISLVRAGQLETQQTWSCGCLKKSHGELKIQQLLEQYNIFYQEEYKFKDCINPLTQRQLRFDFFVDNSYLIEFDGEQHFTQKFNKENLEEIQYRDKIKNDWCKEKGIPLIRIPFYHLSQLTIEDLLLDSSKFIVQNI